MEGIGRDRRSLGNETSRSRLPEPTFLEMASSIMHNAPWLRGFFGADYRDSIERIVTPERTAAEVSFLLEHTGLRSPARVIDLGCGHGRHAIEVARRGFDVTGIDVNTQSLAIARDATPAGVSATFIEGDYAEPPSGPYDLAMCLFGSFGFASEARNAETLHAWADCVRPDGWIVIELWHRDLIVSDFQARRTWQASEDLDVDEQRAFDPLSGRLAVHYDYAYRDGRRTSHDIDVRLYTAAEMRELLARGGVHVTSLFGSMRGDPYHLTSRYLVVVGRKDTLAR
jgi:SAM-dependent methyltransferase